MLVSEGGCSAVSGTKLSFLTLASYHIFIFVAFVIGLPSGGVTVLDSELHHAAECAGHCREESLGGQDVPSHCGG